jgi:hypothetical protein
MMCKASGQDAILEKLVYDGRETETVLAASGLLEPANLGD